MSPELRGTCFIESQVLVLVLRSCFSCFGDKELARWNVNAGSRSVIVEGV